MKNKKEWIKPNGKYECPFCQKEYSAKGIGTHIWRTHGEGKNFNPHPKGSPSWNKGLTKETDKRIADSVEALKRRYKSGELIYKSHPCSEETKKKLSILMIQAHKEGRAWNIGMSRWNNKPSYPEQFFMKVIENEFNDKNYNRGFNVGIYSIDFAWVDKKLAIEIDGEQHQRFKEYKERDARKDAFLIKEGWTILRIVWKDMCNDTKYFIKKANEFVGQ